VGVIAAQLKGIVEEMEREWESNPGSDELGEAFRLLSHYLDYLNKYRKGTA
jgi:hypothetical protein